MGYASRQKYYMKCYTPSNDVIILSAAESLSSNTGWVKMKQMTLLSPVWTGSKFRFKFTLYHVDGGAGIVYGQIYRNGVIVGSLYQRDLGQPPLVCSEDINTTNWLVGDTIEFWGKAATYSRVGISDATLCGLGCEFQMTVET